MNALGWVRGREGHYAISCGSSSTQYYFCCREKVLKSWKNKKTEPEATYGYLLKKCLEKDKELSAMKMVEELKA